MGAMPTPFRAAPAELPPPPVEEEPRSESPGTHNTTTLQWILENFIKFDQNLFYNF